MTVFEKRAPSKTVSKGVALIEDPGALESK